MEWLQHNADVAVIECQPSDVGIWQQRLEARAKQELGGVTSHKPTTWAELTDLICRYMFYRDTTITASFCFFWHHNNGGIDALP